MDSVFKFREKDVAEKLGVPREAVKTIRDTHMEQGKHFELIRATIYLTAEAVEMMGHYVGLPDSEKKDAPILEGGTLSDGTKWWTDELGPHPAPRPHRNMMLEKGQMRHCRVCGCTDDDCSQCIKKTGEPCHWVEDDLCSACVPTEALPSGPAHRLLPATAETTDVRTGKITRICRNHHIVLVESLGETVRMRVRNNAKFRVGMEVPMRLIQEPDLYELARKAPRWRGKW